MESHLRGGRRLWSSCGSDNDSYSTYQMYTSDSLCSAYGANCDEGGGSGSGSNDEDCAQQVRRPMNNRPSFARRCRSR